MGFILFPFCVITLLMRADCEANLHSLQPKGCKGPESRSTRESAIVLVIDFTQTLNSDLLTSKVFHVSIRYESIALEENISTQMWQLHVEGRDRQKGQREKHGYESLVNVTAKSSFSSLQQYDSALINFTANVPRRNVHMETKQLSTCNMWEHKANPKVKPTTFREVVDSSLAKPVEETGNVQKGYHFSGEESLCFEHGNATQSFTIDQISNKVQQWTEKFVFYHYAKGNKIPEEKDHAPGLLQMEIDQETDTQTVGMREALLRFSCGLKKEDSKLYLDSCTVPAHDSDEGTLSISQNDTYQLEMVKVSVKHHAKSYNQQNQTGIDHDFCMLTVYLTMMLFNSDEIKQKLRPLFHAFTQAKSTKSLIHMILQRTLDANNLTNLPLAEDLDHKELGDTHGCDKGKIHNLYDVNLSHNHKSKSTQEPGKTHQNPSVSGDQGKDTFLESPRNAFPGLSQYSCSYLRRFPTVYTVFPASFLPSMGTSAKDSMCHLGSRLASLSALPASCDISRVRLAEAGFYYDDSKTARDASNVHEVVCYSCGLTYGQWKKGDNPTTVHVSLRPDCEYLKSKNGQNHATSNASSQPVTDNAPSLVPDGSSSLASSGISMSDPSSSIMSSGHGSIVRGSSLQQSSVYSTDSGIATGSFNSGSAISRNGGDLATDCSSIPPTRPLNQSAFSGLARDNGAPSRPAYQNSYAASRDTSFARALDLDDRPPLDMNSAVYPQFCRHQERRATFSTWPLPDLFRPDDLVMQGFYYAGYADCLRCFYCGVGLKSWAEDDDVMLEHIRWRPSCGYVLNTKGRLFVDSILNSLGTQTTDSQPSPAPATTVSTNPSTNATETQNTTTEAPTTVRSVNASASANATASSASAAASQPSAAAAATPSGGNASREVLKKVEDMGFSKNSIARAVRHFQQAGMTKISADALVEKIIELDLDDSSDATATNSTPRDGLQTDAPEGASNYDLDADIQRAQRIISENKRLKARQKCKICKQAQVGMIFLPCGHILACTKCGPKTKNCTHCGEFIRATANVYLS